MKLFTTLLTLLCLLSPLSLATELTLPQDGCESFDYTVNHCEYVCLEDVYAYDLLDMRIKYPKLLDKIDVQTKLILVRNKEILILTNINTNLIEQNVALSTEVIVLQSIIHDYDKWYRSPYLWSAIGLIAGTVLTVTIVYSVK